jgi:sortase A
MIRSKEKLLVWRTAVERAALASGLILSSIYAFFLVFGFISSRWAIHEFDTEARGRFSTPSADFSFPPLGGVFRLDTAPMAILRVANLDPIPVFDRTTRVNLHRGAAWIIGTAKPGELGNVGIAAHRDGFFRGLKDVSIGDAIELHTMTGIRRYRVDEIEIVQPENTSVLKKRPAPSITLVTCYPFYFVGNAPMRFIVHGGLSEKLNFKPDKETTYVHPHS